MKTDRRRFLQCAGAGALACTGTAFTGTTQAQSGTTTISGRIVAESGGEIENDEIEISTGRDFYGTRTDSDGRFEAEVPQNTYCDLAFYKADHRSDLEPLQNGVPHVYGLDTVVVESDPVELGELRLPTAHPVDLRVVEPDGEPLRGARPDFHADGWGLNGGRLAVDTDGYTVIEGASFTGIEAAHQIEAEFKPPAGSEYSDRSYRRDVTVEEPTEVVAVVDESDVSWSVNRGSDIGATPTASPTPNTETDTETKTPRTTSPMTDAKTTGANTTLTARETSPGSAGTTTPQRGFFTNGSTSGDLQFMADPFFLTVSGFVMSVVGMTYQLLRGQ